ncbi:MAG: M1 family metallopeptidase, partial [Methylococcales bacterium]
MRHLLLALLAIFSLSHCSMSQPEKENPAVVEAPGRPAAKNLSQDVAVDRSGRVEEVRYQLFFKLDGVEKEYRATETLQFDLRDNNQPLTLDFSDGKIVKLQVNGREVPNFEYNQYFLTLTPAALAVGPNSLMIEFNHSYSSTSAGLYRFKDPEDGRVYLYTDLEPYNANSVFPCFDQPDLKARYAVTAEVPSEWTVISNTREESVTPLDAKRSTWTFPETGPFSTYVFSLHAGEYQAWKSNAERIPLRLFARHSLAKYVDAEEWFRITQQGLQFYQNYFSYPYPFKKYDQLLVPDFNHGAMENVASVTFSERLVQKGKSTRDEREARASVILHEMAHMWFGDLVTMKWWDDLWLNETFATYLSSLASYEATEFKQAWQSFFRGKQRAYIEDQLVTTH